MTALVFTVEQIALTHIEETGEIDAAEETTEFDDMEEALDFLGRARTVESDSGMGFYTSGDESGGEGCIQDAIHFDHGTEYRTGEQVIKSLYRPDHMSKALWIETLKEFDNSDRRIFS